MKWSYSLAGGDDEPVIKDEPVYNANVIVQGEYLQLGASNWTAGADAGYGLVNACVSTVGSAVGINGVGISLQTITTAGNGLFYSLGAPASVATALNTTTTAAAGCGLRTTSSFAFTKTIINPLAVYRTLVSQNSAGTSDVYSIVAAGSSGTLQFVLTGNGTATVAGLGSWVYFCGTAGPNFGTLRKIVSNASVATYVIDAACTNAITSADKVIIFSEMNTNPNGMSTATCLSSNTAAALGTCVSCAPVMTAAQGQTFTNFRVVDNYIEGGTYAGGITQLRYNVQGQYTPAYNGTTPLVNKLSTVNFYQDLISLNNAFNASSTAY